MGREGASRAAVIRATRVLGVATLSLMAACSLMPDTEHLTRLGVRVHESSLGWYQLGPDGYLFEMPGVPLAEREEYRFAGHTVDALFYDLSTGVNWRRYLLRSFDARALSEAEREEMRELAEEQVAMSLGRVITRHERWVEGSRVHEVRLDRDDRAERSAIVQTGVRGGFVFQQVVIFELSDGDWSDMRHFFASLRLRGRR